MSLEAGGRMKMCPFSDAECALSCLYFADLCGLDFGISLTSCFRDSGETLTGDFVESH